MSDCLQLIQGPTLPRPPINKPCRKKQVHQPDLDRSPSPTDVSSPERGVSEKRSDRTSGHFESIVALWTRQRARHQRLHLLSDRIVEGVSWQTDGPSALFVVEELCFHGTCHESDHLC